MKSREHISTGNGIATGNINCDSSKPKQSSYPFILKGYFLIQQPASILIKRNLNNKTSLEHRETKNQAYQTAIRSPQTSVNIPPDEHFFLHRLSKDAR